MTTMTPVQLTFWMASSAKTFAPAASSHHRLRQNPAHLRAAVAGVLGDPRETQARRAQLAHPGVAGRISGPALVNADSPGLGDAFGLALVPVVVFDRADLRPDANCIKFGTI